MQYFAMKKQDRASQFMNGQANPIYTESSPTKISRLSDIGSG